MKNLFSLDGGVMAFLSRVADLLILNLTFIITCIPIVTIGPALTALFSITLKMTRGEDAYIFTGYLKAFKNNFKISFIAWLILLILFYLSYLDFRISKLVDNSLSMVLSIFFFVTLYIGLMITLYLFPYIARFKDTLKQSVKNAILISVASFPYTILLFLITATVIAISVFVIPSQYTILIWLLFGFAALALLQSLIFRRIFAKYEPNIDAEK